MLNEEWAPPSIVSVSENDHFMQAYLGPEGYVQMTWPKKLPLDGLDHMLEIVTLQIGRFQRHARRETEREEAARLEYESWVIAAPLPAAPVHEGGA